MEVILVVFSLILGVSFGSFLNVVIYRVPLKQSIVFPASHCPLCKKPLKHYDNIPILSYLVLGGKCRFCRVNISFRYPLVEVITGLAFLLLLILNDYQLDLILLKNLVFFTCGIAVIFIDFSHHIIPDVISLPLVGLGVLFSFFLPATGDSLSSWQSSVYGAVLGFIIFFIIAWLYQRVKKQDGLGGGDIKYIAGVGAFVGLGGLLFVLFFSSFFALLGYIFIYLLNHKRDGISEKGVAFGPFITLAAFLYLLIGESLIDWYMGFY